MKVFGLTFNSVQARVPDEPTEQMTCGTWTWYAPGAMEGVRQRRGIGQCGDCDGIAVTVNPALLGKHIRIWFRGWRGRYLVVDVGQPGRNRPDLVGEVPAGVAWEWGRAGPWWGCYKVD